MPIFLGNGFARRSMACESTLVQKYGLLLCGSIPSPDRQGRVAMTKRNGNAANGPVRPIKTKRDYDGVSAVIKHLSGQSGRDSAAELRLQSLLREMDRFDEAEDAMSMDFTGDYDEATPRRRWSDDGNSQD
jgi:hypothetical protein